MPPKSSNLEAFGRAVRELRQERGLSLEALAQIAGVHWTYLGGVERGERNLSWENVVKIAAALGVSLSGLVARIEANVQGVPPIGSAD